MTTGTWIKTAIGLSGLWFCLEASPAWALPASPGETGGAAVQRGPSGTTETASPSAADSDRAAFVQSYQKREQAATAQKNFEGGGAGLYIGGSTAAIVLLLVILIVVL